MEKAQSVWLKKIAASDEKDEIVSLVIFTPF